MASQTTITGKEDCVTGAFFAVLGGKFIVRPYSDWKTCGVVLNDAGEVIGDFHPCGSGYAIHTAPVAGTFREDELIWLDPIESAF